MEIIIYMGTFKNSFIGNTKWNFLNAMENIFYSQCKKHPIMKLPDFSKAFSLDRVFRSEKNIISSY